MSYTKFSSGENIAISNASYITDFTISNGYMMKTNITCLISGVVSVENNNQAELTLSEGDDMTLECNTLTSDGVPHTNVKWSKQVI